MLTQILERAGNRLLRFDPGTLEALARLDGKVLKLNLLIVDKTFYILPTSDRLKIREQWSETPDITLTGTPLGFAQFGLRLKGFDQAVFPERKVNIEGDVDLAQDVQRILRQLDLDPEEMLSAYVGDFAARQIGRSSRQFTQWARHAANSLRLDAAEYLVEEARVLAPEWRVADFNDAVDELRADAERLEQRINRLKDSLGSA